MAVTLRATPRRAHLQRVVIGAAMVAGLVAVLPIIFAVFGGLRAVSTARTAFASAPGGDYAVVSRTEGDIDVIAVVPLANPSAAMEIARVRHLPGFPASGAVSADGKHVALAVADAGTASRPSSSLLVVDLETGEQTRLTTDVEAQAPVWAPGGSAVIVARAAQVGVFANLRFVRVSLDGGGEELVAEHPHVLGAYAVAFDGAGRLVRVVIDGEGSRVWRGAEALGQISTQITRDWQLSPDGAQLAFVESNLAGGLRYRARVFSFEPGSAVTAQALEDGSQQLGVAWRPGAVAPTFGSERTLSAPGGVAAQALAAAEGDGVTGGSGFDVPLSYSSDGSGLAVDHWTGSSFAQAGSARLQLITDNGRADVPGFGRFVGWAAR